MKRITLFAITALFGAAACNGIDDNTGTAGGPPPLSAEDQEINAKLEASKLADVPFGEGTVSFYETEPGAFLVTANAPIGAALPKLPADASIVDLYRGLAPNGEMPAKLVAAMDRAKTVHAEIEPATTAVLEPTQSQGLPRQLTRNAETTAPSEQTVTSALASSVDLNWFNTYFCNGYSGPIQMSWCYAQAWTTAYGTASTHFAENVVCADTGAARMRVKVSGSSIFVRDLQYGQCWKHWYHGPHDILGGSLRRTVSDTVDWAENTVRFAGWMKSGDQFVAVPPGY